LNFVRTIDDKVDQIMESQTLLQEAVQVLTTMVIDLVAIVKKIGKSRAKRHGVIDDAEASEALYIARGKPDAITPAERYVAQRLRAMTDDQVVEFARSTGEDQVHDLNGLHQRTASSIRSRPPIQLKLKLMQEVTR
jgi:hypothetical protein